MKKSVGTSLPTDFHYQRAELLTWQFLRCVQYLIDQTIINGAFGFEIIITVAVALDHLERLAGMFRHNPKQQSLQAQNLLGLNFDIGCLTLCATEWLMHMDGGIGQGEAASFGTGGE